jgi:antitoxin ParD1/3/4
MLATHTGSLELAYYANAEYTAVVPTRNVVLTDRQAQLVQSLVESGRYQNASEVIREGLRLVERREQEDSARLHALRSAADVGVSDLENGAFTDFDDPGSLQTYLAQASQDVVDRRTRRR